MDCGLHLQFVALDKDYKYLHHVVKLLSCNGRSTKIKEKKCLPVEVEAQQYQFIVKSNFKKHPLDLLNHVKYNEICTINNIHVMNIKDLIIKIADVHVYITVIQNYARDYLYGTIANVAVFVLFYPNITNALEEKYTVETYVVVLAIKNMLENALM